MPPTTPQNAEPMPASVIPEAVIMKVSKAGSRSCADCMATVSPLAIEPSRAKAASATTSALGKAANSAAMLAASTPATR